MAISAGHVTVEDTATAVASGAERFAPNRIIIKNVDGSEDVFLGGSDVTVEEGFKLEPGDLFEWSPANTDTLYGVVAENATAEVHVLTL